MWDVEFKPTYTMKKTPKECDFSTPSAVNEQEQRERERERERETRTYEPAPPSKCWHLNRQKFKTNKEKKIKENIFNTMGLK
jgi:hypothetical protein